MAQKKIIAHYMHEYEEGPAKQIVQPLMATESFLMANADDAQIDALRAEGLIVQVLDDVAEREPLGARRTRRQVSFTPIAPTETDYYVLELDGPLFPAWRSDLSADGIDLIEALTPARFTSRLTPKQFEIAKQKPFVRSIERYGADDTGTATPRRPAAFGMTATADAYDVRLKRREDKGEIIDWLDKRGIAIEAEYGRHLEVRINASSANDLKDLENLKGVISVTPHVLRYDVLLHRAEDHAEVEQWLRDHNVEIDASAAKKFRVILPDEQLERDLKDVKAVARVEKFVAPDIANDVAREILGIDSANPGASLTLTGQDQIVGVADTGIDDAHPDFSGRIVGKSSLGRKKSGNTTDPDGHGTHVAGSMVGTGQASGGKIRGMAPRAKLFFQSVLDDNGELGGLPLDLHDLFDEAYKQGVRIHNNSWGAAMKGRYTVNSYEIDDFVHANRDMLVVVAAGNEGQAAKRAHSNKGSVDWLSIGSPASCKNALTVGAARSSRTTGGYSRMTYGQAWPRDFPDDPIKTQPISGDATSLAGFSSRGPCDDYRIKPDLVAPGTDILSTRSSLAPADHFWAVDPVNQKYAYDGGTSMAAPIAAGCAALVREYYEKTRSHPPSAALLKATLINGVKRLAGADANAEHNFTPNFHQGFGAIDMTRTVPDPSLAPFVLEFLDEGQTRISDTGDRIRKRFTAGTGWLRLTMAWTDPEGRSVQNSLAMILEHLPTKTKWVGNAQVPLGIVVPDPTNNVVVIRVDNALAGEYVVQFEAYNLLKPPQDFAFVVTGNLQGGIRPY